MKLSSFPNGAHDDMTDSLTQFLNWTRIEPARDPEHEAQQLRMLRSIRLYNL